MLRDEDISVILVDQDDQVVGFGDKLDVHRKGLLHRAFSVLLFNDQGELLLQQRSDLKYHAKGLWANTCCGHPFPGEDVQKAARRRIKEELGFKTDVTPLTHIYYKKSLDMGMIEHEYVHVFLAIYQGQRLQPDPQEVKAIEWKHPRDIKQEVTLANGKYAAWFEHYVQEYYDQLFGHLEDEKRP
jgi:isopentenyl-diphosphate delta-isomerase